MAEEDEVAALVIDNGSGMCKGENWEDNIQLCNCLILCDSYTVGLIRSSKYFSLRHLPDDYCGIYF